MLANSEVAGGILMLLVMMLAYTSPVWMLLIAWLVGRGIEQSHLRDLQRREYDVGRRIIVMGHEDLPPGVTATQGQMVMGTVVVGVDHFKRFLAGWRKLVGGEVRSISPVLTRARREAVLRMLEQADAQGANFVVNIRLETAVISTRSPERQKFGMAEVMAYGTAVKTTAAPAARA
ncbi:MAG: heavy metal-binding domain-containing protein [Planctomycetes bacterium]|nr:heavy metal-binding domain-containing protein [Planctomycetota bacterium]